MKGILKVFAVAVAVAVLGLTLMLMGYATGGPSAAQQALNYTNLSQRITTAGCPAGWSGPWAGPTTRSTGPRDLKTIWMPGPMILRTT